jgi:hypothetical protein
MTPPNEARDFRRFRQDRERVVQVSTAGPPVGNYDTEYRVVHPKATCGSCTTEASQHGTTRPGDV